MIRAFRTLWKWLVPGWLGGSTSASPDDPSNRDEGELVQYTLGLVHDAAAERARQVAFLGLPTYCVSDALELHGRDRAILRGLFEPEASYRARLVAWRHPRGHKVRGNALALLDQVTAAIRGTSYQTIDARGTRYTLNADPVVDRGVTWNWDGAENASIGTQWGRYWIVVKSSALPEVWADSTSTETWDDASTTESWASSSIDSGEIAAVRTLVSNGRLGWTPAGRRPVYLVIYFSGQAYPIPDGTWDSWETRDPQYAYEPLHSTVE